MALIGREVLSGQSAFLGFNWTIVFALPIRLATVLLYCRSSSFSSWGINQKAFRSKQRVLSVLLGLCTNAASPEESSVWTVSPSLPTLPVLSGCFLSSFTFIRKGIGTRDQIANILWIVEKASGDSDSKESTCHCRGHGFDPWSGN